MPTHDHSDHLTPTPANGRNERPALRHPRAEARNDFLRIRKRLAGVFVALFLTLAATPTPGMVTILFDNLPGNGAYNNATSTVFKAEGFTVGANAFTLDYVTLTLSIRADAVYLNLYSDNSGNPGILLTALSPTTSLVSGTMADFTFTPDSPFTLLAGETYWFVASGGGTSTLTASRWMNSSTTATIDPGIIFEGFYNSSDGGATWTSSLAQLTLHLEGTPVPEPSSVALMMGGYRKVLFLT